MDPRIKAVLAIIIGVLISLTTATWSTATTSNVTVSATTNETITTNNSLQVQAYNLLVIVDGVANYTSMLITDLEARNVTIPSPILANYTEAQSLRLTAWDYYTAGFYNKSIETSLNALQAYKILIQSLTEYTAQPTNDTYLSLILEAKASLRRATGYFPYAERVIMKASEDGLNVTGVKGLYHETREAYKKLSEDLTNGNYSALQGDLDSAEKLMKELQAAIQHLNKEITNAEAERIAHAFMKKLEEQMMLTEHLLLQLGNSTGNASKLNQNLAMLQLMYSQLEEMIKKGEYTKALQTIGDASKKLKSVVEYNMKIRRGIEELHENQHNGGGKIGSKVQEPSNDTVNESASHQMGPAQSENTSSTSPTTPESGGSMNPGEHSPTPPREGHKG